jgi:hypothetical protein
MICPKCGTENGDSSLKCVKCWRPLQPMEKGPWLGSKPKLPEQTPSKKSPLGHARRIVSILLTMGMIFSVIVPHLIDKISKYKKEGLKEKATHEAVLPTPVLKEKKAAPAVPDSGERRDTLGVIPSLEAKVTGLSFFESGYQGTEKGNRVYANQFRRERCRYINWELRLSYPERKRHSDFQIDEIWYKPDGSILAKQNLKAHLQESWVWSYHNHSWGWEEPSHWPPGQYRVELSVGGSRIAIGLFTVI